VTVIRLQDGKAIVEDGKVGTEQACCCEEEEPCQCCSSEEYQDCDIQVRRLYSDGTHDVLETIPAGNLFINTEGEGCRFTIFLGDENENGDTVCRINGEIDLTIETCEDCETAGGECVSCCDDPLIVACMQPTEDGRCQLTTQTIDNCGLNAIVPIGPCRGYQFVMVCNPLP